MIARQRAQLHDGHGGHVGHRPGFVYSTDTSLDDAREEAYRLYDEEVAVTYKQDDSFDSDEFDDEAHDASMMDERERAYVDYDKANADAWRGPS